ncbi:MAG TPA: transglycosylase domain-containing protein, partial [Acidimicrobiales bacterium]|nr:transglycosylase domain-containing protein [Acidimicrobiales bacterium]
MIFGGVAGAAYLLTRVPLPADATPLQQTTFIYDANGKQLAALDAGQNRVLVHLNQVPPVVINAVLSTEDRNFYHHGAVDVLGVVRAAIADIRGRSNLQGASTITQQYAKLTYTGRQRTLLRKIKEAALAVKLERKFSKNEILERYLNTIYWGRGAYGIQAAAQAYFQKDVGQLNLPEAALLASLIRSPESLNLSSPHDQAIARARRAETLKGMVRDHHITEAEQAQADQSPLGTFPAKSAELTVADSEHGTQYFIDVVRQQLIQRYTEPVVLRQGLRVTTTLDPTMQDQAYNAVYGAPNGLKPDEPAGALVAVDSQGQVKAMVGGRDYQQSKVNLSMGTQGGGTGRQAGSTFKPFLLAETVKEGYSVESTFPAPPKIILRGKGANGQDYPVSNFQNEDGGASVRLVDATAHSLNTVYAQLEMAIGPDKLSKMATQLGITSNLPANASLVLGTSEVSVLDMASAYSTFADGGTHTDPQFITKVTTADGTPLPWNHPAPRPVLTKNQTDVVNYCLQRVVLYGTGTGAQFGKPVAGKTGTTTDFTDAWFIGYTPKITAAVWMGYPKSATPMMNLRGTSGGVQGGSIPASIFSRFMAAVTRSGDYTGAFDTNFSFSAKIIGSPTSGIFYPLGTGSTTTIVPPSTTTAPTNTTSTTA